MKDIIKKLKQFRDDRNWEQFHTPENLAKSISIEAAELLECFQWSADASVLAVQEELADVLSYALLLSDHYGFDLEAIMSEKIKKNEQKYPKDIVYGKSDKYTKY